METKTLDQIVAEKPFAEFGDWWPMGTKFLNFMSKAIVSEWSELPNNPRTLAPIRADVSTYINAVFKQPARKGLVEEFVENTYSQPMQSGEFDALSYAFYRSAFALIERHIENYDHPLDRERRLFTKRVGKIFYACVHDYLNLDLPPDLESPAQFHQLQTGIRAVGDFLSKQGYLRDHFRFTFEVDIEVGHSHIKQSEANVVHILQTHHLAYALYEMGYPVILPSAVYLYHTIGEAQHHSSRTIEELFERVGYEARETDDFDPINYPSDMVVELWEIRKLP